MGFNSIMLCVTDDCNLACRYCFVQHQPNYMTWEVAKRSVDFLVESNANNNNLLTIVFFGGEPTLMWDKIIVPTVEYCKTFNRLIKFSLTTNGTLLTKERLVFMQENHFSLLLSIDGDKKTQDYNRPSRDGKSSFDKVMTNLPNILEFFPDVTARGTLYPATAEYLINNIMFFNKMNIRRCFIAPDAFSQWDEESINKIKKALREYSLYFIDAYRTEKRIILLNPLVKWFTYDQEQYQVSWCGLGQRIISINYRGDILACQELASYSTSDNPYLLGTIFTGIDQQKIISLSKSMNNFRTIAKDKTVCHNCPIAFQCGKSFCHATDFIRHQSYTGEIPKIECIWSQELFLNSKIIKNILLKNNNEIFISNFLKEGNAGIYD